MIALLFLPVYLIANFYIIWWIVRYLDEIFNGKLHKAVKIVLYIIFWPLPLSMYAVALLPEGTIRRLCSVVGTYWYGCMIYILIVFGIFDLLRFIFTKVFKIPKDEKLMKRGTSIIIRSICLAIIIVTVIMGGISAHTIHKTSYEVDVDKDNGKIDTLNAVLVADQHMGYSVGLDQMQDMVDKINSFNPDIVIMAGDIFDNNYDAIEDPDKMIDIYKQIKSKYGVYAVYGNHDVSEKIIGGFTFSSDEKRVADPRMDEFLQKAGVVNLRDEYVLIDGSFYLYGRPDYQKEGRGIDGRKKPEEITAGLNKNLPIFVIDHQPRELQELSDAGVDIDFSGHTHDGQTFPLNYTAKLTWKNPCGVLKMGNMYSVVTSGVGYFGPSLRVGTKAEVADIKVNFK